MSTDLARPPRDPRRLVYLGTPEVAVPPLRALHAAGYDIALVVTRADKRRGRGAQLVPSPVKLAAHELGLPVTDDVDAVCSVGADLGVVVAYGRLIKRPVLEQLAMINLHFSLLPRWRGAAPVERALLAGDTTTGVCVMALEEGLDTGGVYARAELPIAPDATLASLRAELVETGTALLLQVLREGLSEPEPQTGEATYATKIDPAELAVDFSRPAAEIARLVRLGGAYTFFRGRRLKLWGVAAVSVPGHAEVGAFDAAGRIGTGDGLLELVEVQPEGKGRMPARAWLNGTRPNAGERLGP